MERWVEPFCTWAELIKRSDDAFGPLKKHESTARINDPDQLIHQAWKLLISNQPHDSICGCSVDETHNDMISRFDQLDQIAETLTEQSLEAILSEINTEVPDVEGKFSAITVFNAAPYPKTDLVSVNLEMPNENFAPELSILTEMKLRVNGSGKTASFWNRTLLKPCFRACFRQFSKRF